LSGKFAENVRREREKKKLTIEELAEQSGIPAPTLYCWENGTRSPINDSLADLAKGLGVPLRSLIPKDA